MGVALAVTAAALLVTGQAQAQAAPTLVVVPNHGPVGTLFQAHINDNGTQVNCNLRGDTAQFTWDAPNTQFARFSNLTVPNGSYIGVHSKLQGRCTKLSGLTYNTQGTFTVEAPTTTTTTTTTQPKTTTTTTTQPKTTTTTTTQPGQTTTTQPGQTTTTTTTQPGDTLPLDTTTSAPPPTTPEGKPIVLKLDQPATPPGGDDQATGEGCEPNTPVTLTIEGGQVGSALSDANGHFASHIDVPNLPVGQYDVFARCGRLLTTKIDLVLPSTLGPPSGTLTVLFFFLLLGFALVRRQIAADLRR